MNTKTTTLILVALALALAPTVPADEANHTDPDGPQMLSATWLSVTIEDLLLDEDTKPEAIVTLELVKGEQTVAQAERSFDLSNGPTPIEGLTAAIEDPSEGFSDHVLEARVLVDGEHALTVAGIPVETTTGSLEFRVTNLHWPQGSPIHPTPSEDDAPILSFARGWSSDDVRIAFAPKQPAKDANATIHLEASEGTPSSGEARLFEDEAPVSEDEDGNLFAVFELENLPPELGLQATLLLDGKATATLWSQLNFPAGKSWSSGYDPGQPAVVEAGAEVHNVEDHSDRVTVPASVLQSVFPVTRADEDGQGFARVTGTASYQLTPYLDEAQVLKPAQSEEASGTEEPEPETEAGTEDEVATIPVSQDQSGLATRLIWIFAGLAATLLVSVMLLRRWGGRHGG